MHAYTSIKCALQADHDLLPSPGATAMSVPSNSAMWSDVWSLWPPHRSPPQQEGKNNKSAHIRMMGDGAQTPRALVPSLSEHVPVSDVTQSLWPCLATSSFLLERPLVFLGWTLAHHIASTSETNALVGPPHLLAVERSPASSC